MDSNHTCVVYGIGYDCGALTPHLNKHNDEPQNNKRRKILRLFLERNKEGLNVHCLERELGDKETLKLVPHVMHSVQFHSQQGKLIYYPGVTDSRLNTLILSCMHELMKGWKMPELYQRRL